MTPKQTTSKSTMSHTPIDNPKLVITHSHFQETPCELCSPKQTTDKNAHAISLDGKDIKTKQTIGHNTHTLIEQEIARFDKEIGIIEGYKLCITYEDQQDQDVEEQVKDFLRTFASRIVESVIEEDEEIQSIDFSSNPSQGNFAKQIRNDYRKEMRTKLQIMKGEV